METKRSRNVFFLHLSLATFLLVLVLVELSSHFRVSAMQASTEKKQCSSSMVECSDQVGEEESSMESETGRRIVRAINYITPGALKADSPFCAKPRGDPYHGSCLPPPSNPQNRGCNKFYRCRS